MSNELRLLSQWLPFGIFSDTEDLTTEIVITSIAEMMSRLEYQSIDGLELDVLLIVCGIKYFKDTKIVPDAQNIYDALVAFHNENRYDLSENKQQWANAFNEQYKTRNNINGEQF
jgi:hypothetical protein